MARITLLGGTRFIGPEVTAQLLERGHDVSLVHRGVHPNTVVGARVILADRTNVAALRVALPKSDVVVDMRAMNATQAEIAIAALHERTERVVVLSSQDVYAQFGALLGHPSPPPEELVTEDSPLTVPRPYENIEGAHDDDDDYDKLDVERLYRESRLGTVTILRLAATYGSGDPSRRFGEILDALDAGERRLPRVGGHWRWTHAHVRDVAYAIVLAAERDLVLMPGHLLLYHPGVMKRKEVEVVKQGVNSHKGRKEKAKAKGDAISAVMAEKGIGFPEAMKEIAENALASS